MSCFKAAAKATGSASDGRPAESLRWNAILRNVLPVGATLVVLCIAPAWSQAETVNRAANGAPGKDIQVGLYVNVRPDCSSGPLPTIRLSVPPEHGNVTIKKAKFNATNYKQCLATEGSAYVAFYKSRPDFSGVDVMTLEVTYANRTEIQRITVTVGSDGPGQRT